MKTRRLSITVFACLLIVSFFLGCKGPQGEVGPEGPQGPVGNENVIVSSRWNAYSNAWAKAGDKTRFLNQVSNSYDKNKDAAVVFVRYENSGEIYQLPYESKIGIGYLFEYRNIRTSYTDDALAIYATSEKVIADSHVETQLSKFQFKWVIFKGARKAAIDYSDYEAVKKAYNLPD